MKKSLQSTSLTGRSNSTPTPTPTPLRLPSQSHNPGNVARIADETSNGDSSLPHTHPPPCPPTAKPTIAYATPTPSTPPTPLPAPPLAHACLPAPPSRPSANYPLSCQRRLRKLITVDKSEPSQTATHPPQPQPSSSRPTRWKTEQRKVFLHTYLSRRRVIKHQCAHCFFFCFRLGQH